MVRFLHLERRFRRHLPGAQPKKWCGPIEIDFDENDIDENDFDENDFNENDFDKNDFDDYDVMNPPEEEANKSKFSRFLETYLTESKLKSKMTKLLRKLKITLEK